MTFALAIFSKLPGSWTFSRTIPNFGTMSGRAVFSLMPNEENFLHYREEGVITLAITKTTQAFFKEYIYGCSQTHITIYFNENPRRTYHVLNLEKKTGCEADHQCNDDSYHGIYDFNEPHQGQFKITYQVKGPKKDSVIVTQFTKEHE